MNPAKLITEVITRKNVDQLRNILNNEKLNFNIDTVIGDDAFTSLHLAIKRGSEDQVKLLLEKGADTRLKTQNGDTCLHLAVESNKFELVKLILPKVNVNEVNNSGQTSLHVAVANRKMTDYIELLLFSGADPNSPDNEGNTPFHLSFGMKIYEITKCFLFHGANVEVKDGEGRNALHLAAVHTRIDSIEDFVSMKMDVREVTNTRKTVLHLLLDVEKYDYRVPYDCQDREMRSYDTAEESVAVARCINLLIERGADVGAIDNSNKTPLDYAIEKQNELIVICQLLACGAKINCAGKRSTVFHAIEQGDLKWIKQLISRFESAESSLAIKVINLPNVELRYTILKFLLENKVVDVDEVDSASSTLLHLSIRKVDMDLFRLLIEHGANLYLLNQKKQSVLYLSVKSYMIEATRMLVLDKNVKVQRHDQTSEFSILHAACLKGQEDVVKLLLDNGANPNDMIAWLSCGLSGSPNLVELIESYGGILKPDSFASIGALMYASLFDKYDMMEYLIDRGANINSEFHGQMLFEFKYDEPVDWEEVAGILFQGNFSLMFEDPKMRENDTIVVDQIALLLSQGLHVNERNWDRVRGSRVLSLYYEKCLAMLQLAKNTPVCDGFNLVYLDFLTQSICYLSKRLRSEEIRAAFESADCTIFKSYQFRIKRNYARALAWLEKVIQFEETLRDIFGSVLPDCVIRMLGEYYNVRDYQACIAGKA